MKNKDQIAAKKKLRHRIIDKIRQRLWLTAAIVMLTILITSAILFFLGIRINFLINDELRIDLIPLDKSILLHYNESTVLNFTITTKNFIFCKAYCEYKLIDLSNNKIISESNEKKDKITDERITSKILNANEKIVLNYDLTADLPGSGQILYSFEARCNNIKSFLCSTDEQPRYKTSFITFNYDLTEQEKSYKQKLHQLLRGYFQEIKGADISNQENTLLLDLLLKEVKDYNKTPAEIMNLAAKNYEYDNDIANLQAKATRYISLWEQEKYLELHNTFIDGNDRDYLQVSMYKFLWIQKDLIINLINLHNSNIEETRKLLQTLAKLNEMRDYFRRIGNVKDRNATEIYFNELEATYNAVNNNEFRSYREIKDNIGRLDSQFDNISSIYEKELEKEKDLTDYNLLKLKTILELLKVDFSGEFGSNCEKIDNLSTALNGHNIQAKKFLSANYSKYFNNTEFNQTLAQLKSNILLEVENRIANASNNITQIDFNNSLNLTEAEYYTSVAIEPTPEILDYNSTYCIKREFNDSLEIPTGKELKLVNNFTTTNITSSIYFTLSTNEPRCCVFGECKNCCTFETCDDERNYPIIFLHGHSFNKKLSPDSSIAAFAGMQKKLQEEGIINAGEITLASSKDETAFAEYGRSGLPVSFRATYYYIGYFDLGRYQISTQKSEKIENYALRLRELIELVKYRTGAKKVNIVAHSMGGLVAREYIALFGNSENNDNKDNNINNKGNANSDINKLILIAAPNKGIRSKVQKYCSFIGAEKECEDMAASSIFMKRLNDKNTNKKTNNIYTIAGIGCKMDSGNGDGIVYLDDAKLDDAKNFVVEGSCKDSLGVELHNNLLNTELYSKVYDIVKQILKE